MTCSLPQPAQNELLRQNIKANELWDDILDNAKFEAEQRHKTLEITSPPGPWTIYCNPSALGSAFENIVRNALRYSNQHIQVAFSADTKGISIVVDDDGPVSARRSRTYLPSVLPHG